MKLMDMAEIKSGYLFPYGIKSDKAGAAKLIQLKDVTNDGILNVDGLNSISLPPGKEYDFLKQGDILFKAKSGKHVAAIFNADMKNVIATAHYFIVSVKSTKVRPGYLAWYLNQRPAQIYFAQHAGGTHVPVINLRWLGDLEIEVPDMKTQEAIEKVYALHQREQDIEDVIKEKKHELVLAQLLSAVKK